MGNSQTKLAAKLDATLPGRHGLGWEDWWEMPKKKHDHLANVADRNQFIRRYIDKLSPPLDISDDGSIDTVSTVITQNGKRDFSEHDFRLLYGRRDNDCLVARIVAQKEGIITAKIEAPEDGKDQVEAFRALRRHTERELNRLLDEIPNDIRPDDGRASLSSAPIAQIVEIEVPRRLSLETLDPNDAPPTYGNAMGDPRDAAMTRPKD